MAGDQVFGRLHSGHGDAPEEIIWVDAQTIDGRLDRPFCSLRERGDAGVVHVGEFGRMGKLCASEIVNIVQLYTCPWSCD